MSTPRVSRFRIVTALLAALIVVSIVPLVISHVALVRINREALETAEKKYLTRSAVTLAQDVDTYLKNAQMQLRRIADGMKLAGWRDALVHDKKADRNGLRAVLLSRPGVARVARVSAAALAASLEAILERYNRRSSR